MKKLTYFFLVLILFKTFSPALVYASTGVSKINAAQNIHTGEIATYVNSLTNQIRDMLKNENLTKQQKINSARSILASNLDLKWMGIYTLGRYKNIASKISIDEFLDVYSSYISNLYSDIVSNYKGEEAAIKNIHNVNENEFVVYTEIIKPNSTKIKVDYMVRKNQDKSASSANYKIFDVITENISMINSQKAEFGSVLHNQGVEALTVLLREKLPNNK